MKRTVCERGIAKSVLNKKPSAFLYFDIFSNYTFLAAKMFNFGSTRKEVASKFRNSIVCSPNLLCLIHRRVQIRIQRLFL